jgi:hypothetical protein
MTTPSLVEVKRLIFASSVDPNFTVFGTGRPSKMRRKMQDLKNE